jgi:hypothetical protein
VSENDLAFVRGVVGALEQADVRAWIFGGWAEELLELTRPRSHHDLDLLYPAQNFDQVDVLLAGAADLSEITAKRLPHKRAFLREGVMTELILVRSLPGPTYVTDFWGRVRYQWPTDVLVFGDVAGLRVASPAAVQRYRAEHGMIHAASRYQRG